MADEADRAQDVIEESLAANIAAARGVVPQPGKGSSECSECGGEVGPCRAAAGYRTCIDCARDAERVARFVC